MPRLLKLLAIRRSKEDAGCEMRKFRISHLASRVCEAS